MEIMKPEKITKTVWLASDGSEHQTEEQAIRYNIEKSIEVLICEHTAHGELFAEEFISALISRFPQILTTP